MKTTQSRKTQKEKKSVQVVKYVLTTLLSVGLALYIGYHLINSLDDSIKTVTTTLVTQEMTYTQDAYLFRSEKVVYAPEGSYSYLVEDGQRAAVNTALLQVYGDKSGADHAVEIAAIDRRLALLRNSNMQQGVSYNDTAIIDADINNLYYTILQKLRRGETDFAIRKSDDLMSDINRRQIVTGKIENYNDKISELEAQRTELEQHSGEVIETVRAEESGYFYSDIDGFEMLFNPVDIDYMTPDAFRELIRSEADLSIRRDGDGRVAAGKLITDFAWYVTMEIDVSETRYYGESKTYTLIFPYNSDKRIEARLEKIIRATDNGTAVLVFMTRENPENFNFLRRQSVSIVRTSREGYRVPISAVRIRDGEQGVYVLRGMEIYFKKITPILESDGYFIAQPNDGTVAMRDCLALNDEIVVSGKNLYDGKIVS